MLHPVEAFLTLGTDFHASCAHCTVQGLCQYVSDGKVSCRRVGSLACLQQMEGRSRACQA